MTGNWGQLLISDGKGGALPPLSAYGQNVKSHGAVGDGVTDDSAAFREAAAAGLFVYVPPGRYVAHGIPLRSGAQWRGCGGGYVNSPGAVSTIVTNDGDLFVPDSPTMTGTAFSGIALGNRAGGGHVFNLDGALVFGLSLDFVYFDLQVTAKSAIRAHVPEIDCCRFTSWGVNANALTVPALDIVSPYITANRFDHATFICAPGASEYVISMECETWSNANVFSQLLFEIPTGGAIKLLSAQNSAIDQCVVVPEGYMPNGPRAYVHIGKSTAVGAVDGARISFRGGWHGGGTADNPSVGLYDGTTDVSFEAMYVSYLHGNGNPIRIASTKIDASDGVQ